MAGVKYIQPGTYKKSGHLGFTASAATKDDVGCFEFDGESGLVSVTRQLPTAASGARRVVSACFAIVGPDSGSLAGVDFCFGLCPSHARRYGQPTEHVLHFGDSTRAASSWSGTTYANTSPTPNVNYQWNNSWWNVLTSAGVVTTNGSGYGNSIPRANQDFSDGLNASHFNHRWASITMSVMKTTATTAEVRYEAGHYFIPKDVPKQIAWDHPDSLYHPRYCSREAQLLVGQAFPANDINATGNHTVENVDFDFLNIAWACTTSGARLLVRDIYIGDNRDGTSNWVP